MKKYLFFQLFSLIYIGAFSQPVINSFSPLSGSIGTSVVINGSNFNAVSPNNNVVFFGTTQASILGGTAATLTVTVPSEAAYQYISITDITTGLTGYSATQFNVQPTCPGSVLATTYSSKTDFSAGSLPLYIATGDIDGDGKTDVIVANYASNSVSISRNISTNGNINFATKVEVAVGSTPNAVNIMDFDGDGKLDITTVNGNSATVSVLLNASTVGNISFSSRSDYGVGPSAYSMTSGDVDGDGKPEIISFSTATGAMSVLQNTSTKGNISFSSAGDFALFSSPVGGAMGDIDGDGKLDVVTCNQQAQLVYIARNTSTIGSISFASPASAGTGAYPEGVAIGDVDGDGHLDLAVVNGNSNTVSVFQNTSMVGSISFSASKDYATGTEPSSIAFGEINGDGKPDMVISNMNANTASVLENSSTSGAISFGSRIDFASGNSPNSTAICDLDGDNRPDFVMSNQSSSSFSAFLKEKDPIMTSVNTATVCSGGTVSLPFTSNALASYSWIATNNVNTIGESLTLQTANALNNTITNSSNSAQNIIYTVTPTSLTGGCVGVAQTITVTVNPKPAVISPNTAIVCDGNSFGISLASNSPSTFSWVAADNVNVSGESTIPQTTNLLTDLLNNNVSTIQKVIYTVTPTYTNSSCAGTNQTVTVTVMPTPNNTNSSSITICSGDNVNLVLTANVNSTYDWLATDNINTTGESTNNQSSSIINDVLINNSGLVQSVIYTVTPTSVSGLCAGNAQTVTVNINPLPTVVANATSSVVCTGSTITLSGAGANTYTWSGGITNAVPFVINSNATYSVTGTDGNGCKNTAVKSITVNPLPNVSINASSSTVCAGNATTLTGIGTATTYTWNSGVADGVSFIPASTSGYTVTGIDGNNCLNTATITVVVQSLPSVIANATQTVICLGDLVKLTGAGATTYTWSNGVNNGINFYPATSNTYTVTGMDIHGCTNSSSISVNVNALPNVGASSTATLVCKGNSVTLNGSGALTYAWSNGITDGVSFAANSNQTYTVTGTDVNGCSNTASISISIIVPPIPNICLVTTDTSFVNNIIYWDKSLYPSADSFIVYRYDVSSSSYLKLGSVSKDSSQFTDLKRNIGGPNGGDPNVTSWQYKLAVKDTCGNISAKSPYHQTVNIQQNNQNISWNAYGIEAGQVNPVSGYQVLRDSLGIGDWHVFVNTSGLSTNDPAYAIYPNARYRVDALGFNCSYTFKKQSGNNNNIFTIRVRSHSNQNNNKNHSTGIKMATDNKVNIFPNPTNGIINIEFEYPMDSVTFKITSLLGSEIYLVAKLVSARSLMLDANYLEGGSYLLHITGKDFSMVKKIVKQ